MIFDMRKKTNALKGLKTGLTMIEQLYEKNLLREMEEMDELDFPRFIKACRELMGLKQYACSEYLGMKEPRYKKLESGRFAEPLEEWEIRRMQSFFKLPYRMLHIKQDQFLNGEVGVKNARRHDICKDVWGQYEGMAGERGGRGEA